MGGGNGEYRAGGAKSRGWNTLICGDAGVVGYNSNKK
jgi:hypothetical protein